MSDLLSSMKNNDVIKKRSSIGKLMILGVTALILVGGAGVGLFLLNWDVMGKQPVLAISLDGNAMQVAGGGSIQIGRNPSVIVTSLNESPVCNLVISLSQDTVSQTVAEKSGEETLFSNNEMILSLGDVASMGFHEGDGTLTLSAKNCSLIKRKGVAVVRTVIDFMPPAISVTSSQHYINQGGADVVTYTASDDVVWSGVKVGPYKFVGHKVSETSNDYFAFFVFSYDVDASTPIQVVAMDAAGNESVQTIVPARFYAKEFRHREIEIPDSFIQSKVADIIRNTPTLSPTGSNLNDFVLVNRNLRKENISFLMELSKRSEEKFYWKDAFVPLKNAAIEANFADYRSYMYNGQKVDEQVHLGFDMAVTRQYPITASGAGKVVMAKYFGIYGNAVLIDHGYGLMSLYGHLSGMDVEEGDVVAKGEKIGNSGETGMAGGDHLHFSMLIDGIQTNPVEFWDQHWIDDHVYLRIGKAAFGQ